jgi:hypothetical protein
MPSSTGEALASLISLVIVYIVLLLVGKFLWNEYLVKYVTIVKPIPSVIELLAISKREKGVELDQSIQNLWERLILSFDANLFTEEKFSIVEQIKSIKPKKHSGFNIGYIGTVDYSKIHCNFLNIASKIKTKLEKEISSY